MSKERDLIEFRDLLDRHGSRPEDWPAERREKMLQLCADSPQARALLAEAEALDALFHATAVPAATPDLAERLLRRTAAVVHGAENESAGTPSRSAIPPQAANDNQPVMRWLAAGWLAASLLIGIWLGLSGRIIVPQSLLDSSEMMADATASDALADLLGIVSSVEEGGETL